MRTYVNSAECICVRRKIICVRFTVHQLTVSLKNLGQYRSIYRPRDEKFHEIFTYFTISRSYLSIILSSTWQHMQHAPLIFKIVRNPSIIKHFSLPIRSFLDHAVYCIHERKDRCTSFDGSKWNIRGLRRRFNALIQVTTVWPSI
jgi:hypothetical protein